MILNARNNNNSNHRSQVKGFNRSQGSALVAPLSNRVTAVNASDNATGREKSTFVILRGVGNHMLAPNPKKQEPVSPFVLID